MQIKTIAAVFALCRCLYYGAGLRVHASCRLFGSILQYRKFQIFYRFPEYRVAYYKMNSRRVVF